MCSSTVPEVLLPHSRAVMSTILDHDFEGRGEDSMVAQHTYSSFLCAIMLQPHLRGGSSLARAAGAKDISSIM